MLATTLLSGLVAHAAFAGSPAPAPADAALPAPASAVRDWSGIYGGLSASSVGGDMTYSNTSTIFDFDDDTAVGAFLGYNLQSGALVYGAELALPNFDSNLVAFPQETLDGVVEARARLGYAMGDALLYGFVGYAQGTFMIPLLTEEWDVSGMNYGVGLDYAIGEHFFLGGAASFYDLSGDTGLGFEQSVDLEVFQLRAGYRF